MPTKIPGRRLPDYLSDAAAASFLFAHVQVKSALRMVFIFYQPLPEIYCATKCSYWGREQQHSEPGCFYWCTLIRCIEI